MAQHYKIESWSNEKWYPKIMKRIKWILKYTSGNRSYYGSDYYLKRLSILPKEYCTDVFGNNEGNLALSYKTTLKDVLDRYNNYQLSDCNIEIHSQSRGLTQNKYIQAYIVL